MSPRQSYGPSFSSSLMTSELWGTTSRRTSEPSIAASSSASSQSVSLSSLHLASPLFDTPAGGGHYEPGGAAARAGVRRKGVINHGDRCSVQPSSSSSAGEGTLQGQIIVVHEFPSQVDQCRWLVVRENSTDEGDDGPGSEESCDRRCREPADAPSGTSSDGRGAGRRHDHRREAGSEGESKNTERRGRDPPGESPTSRVAEGGGGRADAVRWVDPLAIPSGAEVDPRLLERCRALLDSSHPRIRVATISSGYKKANFFVREDVDQRIYFHDLEDAVSYMGRRGYARMRKEDEKEWRDILGRAHTVVKKAGRKKTPGKQRYRKGNLVLVMFKPIRDDPPPSSPAGAVNAGAIIPFNADDNSTDASSGRASLGRSVRGPYRSYAERFLAETGNRATQPEVSLLTWRPVDPPEPAPENNDRLLRITDGTGEEDSAKTSESGAGAATANYGGGVRYFYDDCGESERTEDTAPNGDDESTTFDDSGEGSQGEDEEEYDSNINDDVISGGSSYTTQSASYDSEFLSAAGDADEATKDRSNLKQRRQLLSPPDLGPVSSDSEDFSCSL